MGKAGPYRALAIAGSLLFTTLSPAISAQDEPVKIKPQRDESLMLEEVVVTAQRRAQSIQEVPMSVTAFTGEFFQESGVTNLAGLDQYTPSLKITPGADSRSTSIRIRGIGSVGTNVGIDPSVGLFIDGVYQGRAGMSISDLMDIERVEILRGPQGTLYGKNTAAGAISIITMRPSMEYEGEIELIYNTDEQIDVHGMVNVPFGDSGHATRLTGFVIDGDHLYNNTANGQDLNDANKWGVKSRTLFDTGAFMDGDGIGEFLLTMDYTKEDTDCCALAVSEYQGLSSLNSPGTNSPTQEISEELGLATSGPTVGQPILQWNSFEDSEGFSPPRADPFDDDYWVDADIYNKVKVGGVALEWNKDVAWDDTLTFINAWRHYESDSGYDGDFTGYDAVTGTTDIELDQYSSELRITSPGGETFDYQGGIFLYYSELDSDGTITQSPSLVGNIEVAPGLPLSLLFPNGTVNTDTNNYETTSYAVFGQVTWNITEQFSTTLGMRYTYEEKDRKGSQISDPDLGDAQPDIPPIVGPPIYYDESRNDDDISPTLIARYFVTPDIMTYASISRGFKSGGFNQRRELEGLNGEFDEETATNYELGWKGSTEDSRVQFNGTFYYVKYDDFQTQSFDGSSIRVTNAGSMESYGTELELVFVPLANMVVSSALGYNKAEYDDFDNGQCTIGQEFDEYYIKGGAQFGAPGLADPPCTQDLGGESIDNAPEWTVSSFVQYDMDLTDNLVGIARLEHSYIDSFYLDQDLDPNLENDSVNLINLRLTLTNPDNSWEVAAWGRNLLDEEYYGIGLDIPTLGGFAGVTAPGIVGGITVRFRH